jgi:hypothetical protein
MNLTGVAGSLLSITSTAFPKNDSYHATASIL